MADQMQWGTFKFERRILAQDVVYILRPVIAA